MIKATIRVTIGALGVSVACLASVVLAPSSPAPAIALSCLAFVGLGIVSGRSAVVAAVAVGALELAFILPGQGFAVSNGGDALGLLGAIAAGLLIAWRAGTDDNRINALEDEARDWKARAQHAEAARDEVSERAIDDIAKITDFVADQACDATNIESRQVLEELNARLMILGRVYESLRFDRIDDDYVDARMFLTELSTDLCKVRLESRPLTVRLSIEQLVLPGSTIVIIGLILNELLSNVYRNASPGDHPGHLSIVFTRHLFQPRRIRLVVTDDRIGSSQRVEITQQPRRPFADALSRNLEGELSYARLDRLTIATFDFTAPV